MSIKINATNLHSGGSLQVAVSFLQELASDAILAKSCDVLISTSVYESLIGLNVSFGSYKSYKVIDTYGFIRGYRLLRKALNSGDTVFTIIGPLYIFNLNFYSIVGFAQGWIAYPSNCVYSKLNFLQLISTRAKFLIQRIYYFRANLLIVEHDHVKDALIGHYKLPSEYLKVINNAVSKKYLGVPYRPSIINRNTPLRIGYMASNNIHKNHKVLFNLSYVLFEKYGIQSKIFVTLDEKTFNTSEGFADNFVNMGVIPPEQSTIFYEEIDICVFPSLLECYSAFPIESMAMSKPLLCSDTEINRRLYGEYTHYFDPNSTHSLASQIYSIVQREAIDLTHPAFEFVRSQPSATDRMIRYMTTLGV